MTSRLDRREFVRSAATVAAAAALAPKTLAAEAPTVHTPKNVRPIVISDLSGLLYKNGGPVCAVEQAFAMIVGGADVLDALIAGVNIPELDPEESGVGYGGLPNADGVVQLDACCMHGPKKWAGGVAALEGVRTPSLVAKAVMEHTDHHLLVGKGAQEYFLYPKERIRRGYEIGLEMLREGLIKESHFWGTINCNGISPSGDICGVTTTSGLSWKIPGRTGDSPILGAGLYVDGDVGAAGSTGRGEANLFNLSSFLIVEQLRRGMHPKDAGMEALKRIRANTVEQRLLNERGLPNFNVRFFVLDAAAEYAGVSMYASGETEYALCTENGAEARPLEPLLEGSP